MDDLPLAVNVKDQQGRWLYANATMLSAFGAEGVDYQGLRDSELVPENHFYYPALCYCEATDGECFHKGGVSHSVERIPNPDESVSCFEVTKVVLESHDTSGDRLLVVGYPADARDQLQTAVAEMRPLVDVGELVPGLIHDLNNLLTLIMGNAEMLQLTNPSEDSRSIINASLLMRSVISTLSAFSDSTKKRDPIDLAKLIQKVCGLIFNRSESRTLRVSLPEDPVWIFGTPSLISRAILNLLINARQWSPADGTIQIGLQVKGDTCVITVEDTGPGIPSEQREHIWDTGTTHREGGSGLGLNQVLECAEAHQGRCRIETSSLGGALFVLELNQGREKQPSPSASLRKTKGLTILLAEPDHERKKLVSAMLSADHAVVELDTGHIEKRPEADLVILDLDLPHHDGLQMIRLLRENGFHHPAILTVANTADLRLQSKLPEGVHLLRKPYQRKELEEIISTAMTRT